MRIPTMHVGRAVAVGPVTVFPVWAEVPGVPGLRTGAGAELEVHEAAGGPAVDRLSVGNPGPAPVLLVEGELLEGGWQTRAVVQDVIVRPRVQRVVPVVCVEQGRWSGDVRHARAARHVTTAVRRHLRGHDDAERQHRVWAEVSGLERLGTTVTGSLGDHVDRVPAHPVPRPVRGQNDVVIGIAGRPVGLELFGGTRALTAHLPGIVRAAVLQAALAGSDEPVPSRRVRRFVTGVERLGWVPGDVEPGGGVTWCGGADALTVRGLTVGRGLAHLAAVTA